MNKRTTLLLCLLGASFLTGCSGIGVFDGRSIWSEDSKEISANEPEKSISVPKQSEKESDSVEASAALGNEFIESFPEWFKLASYDHSDWTKIVLNPQVPLSQSLQEKGIPSEWLRELRLSDYIDLSTISDQQVLWVETSVDGSFASAYTPVTSHKAFYIKQTESGPVMTRGPLSPASAGSFEVAPYTKISDLSHTQKIALNDFLSSVLPAINHEAEVLLSKGTTQIFFQYTFLQKKEVGNVFVTKARSKYKDFLMTYIPE